MNVQSVYNVLVTLVSEEILLQNKGSDNNLIEQIVAWGSWGMVEGGRGRKGWSGEKLK